MPALNSNQRSTFKLGFAKNLPSNPTGAERRFWWLLRAKQLGGLRFQRQQPIGPYIVNFFCPAAKLMVELNGDHHGSDNRVSQDAIRTRWLEEPGYKVLRFANGAVLKNAAMDMIWQEAQGRSPIPERPAAVRPSRKGRVG